MRLTMALMGTNVRTEALIDGAVRPENIELDFQSVNNLYHDNLHNDRLDVSEMSISESLIARERRDRFGGGKWDWSAIPAFMSRGHGWTNLYVRKDSAIESLGDLKGKRVGIPDYEMTYAVWFRIVLKDLYGIEAGDIEWFNIRKRGDSHGLELFLDEEPPAGVGLHFFTPEQDEYEMLLHGELDAAPLPRGRVQENPDVRRLLPDGGKAVITEFYRKTDCFQPNHHYIVQNRIVQEHPWVARSIFEALNRAKETGYERGGEKARLDEGTGLGPEVFGEDPYPQGIKAMRKTLERAARGLQEQGLLRQPVRLEDVYHPSLLET